jgi:uncharacterized protein YcbK (DUF882 family)
MTIPANSFFSKEELQCPCCKIEQMNEAFVLDLIRARRRANIPFNVTSGYRCVKHNATLPKASPTSSHMKGLAIDISCENDNQRLAILAALLAIGFQRIGIAKDFIHVDKDTMKAKGVWMY